ncbi:MAG TPA: hypothetical protein VER33_25455 [Polyangiaceae bacterium]|nr:hypothetical protein [Polyangiaceae bacterium]
MSARLRPWLLLSCGMLASGTTAAQPELSPQRWVLFAERDDDDDNGRADAAEPRLDAQAATDVRWLSSSELPPAAERPAFAASAALRWVAADGRVLAAGSKPLGVRKLGLQGLRAGFERLSLGDKSLELSVVEVVALDALGTRVDLSTSHASLSRVLPAGLSHSDPVTDRDALRWMLVGDRSALPERVNIVSLRPDGRELDLLSDVELRGLPCPDGTAAGLTCRATPLIRATADRIDRGHPQSADRSLQAEVGGRIAVHVGSGKATSIRVGGPRNTALGAIERFRSRMRVHVLRATVGGAPAVGADAPSALELVRADVDTASLLWGQCGIHFGNGEQVPVQLVDPPPAHLIAVGCGLGLPASGGQIRLRIGGAAVQAPTYAGETPEAVALRLAAVLRRSGLSVLQSSNPRIEPGAFATSDLSVRTNERLATVERDGAFPLSSDPSLEVCIGAVDLSDGLAHFTDFNAVAGTLEERTLIKAYADRDSSTIDVFVVPTFSGVGRVGESFLDMPGASIHNTVLIDREAIRAGARSHVLAHELGHLLLDMPGHPDDYGVDQPSSLMDSDATDPTIFGPRRLSVSECERALRQRGPGAAAPLLSAWPLFTRGR